MTVAKNRPNDRTSALDAAPDAQGNELDRVREILFGQRLKATSDGIDALEQRMTERLANLRKDMLAALGEQAASQQRRLDAAIEQATAAWHQGRAALQAELLQKLAGLRSEKVDRDDLAALLGGLATRLGKQAKNAE